MFKAKFVSREHYRSRYEDFELLTYEYRGRQYVVEHNLRKGSIPDRWQHQNEQTKIDVEIEREEYMKNHPQSPQNIEETLKKLFAYFDGDESAFDD